MSTKLELVLEAIDRASGPIRDVERAIGKVERAAERSSGVMGRSGDVGSRAMRAIGTAAKVAALAGVIAITAGLTDGIAKAIAFESAMADVRKVVDFPTPDGFAQMSADVLEMSKHIPVAATGLATIVAEAGSAGVAADELLAFTELVAQTAIAFDMTAEAAGESYGKLRNVFQLDTAGLRDASDAVNHLSNAMASKAPEIVDFLTRAGGAAPLLGMSAEHMAALGSTMISLGTVPETAARGVGALFTNLKVGGEKIEAAMRAIGLSRTEFLALAEIDPGAAFEKLFSAVDKSEAGLASLVDLVGKDFADDFLKVAGNTELLAQAFELVGQKAGYTGSVLKEFEARAATTANNWQLFKNNMDALKIETFSRILPQINAGLTGLIDILQTLGDRVTVVDRVSQALKGLADGLGLDRLTGAGAVLSSVFTPITEFLVGTADAEARIGIMSRIFDQARTAGEALRPVLDAIGTGFATFEATLRSLGASVSEIALSIAAGFSAHIEPIGARIGTLTEAISGNVTRMLEIAGDLGTGLATIFAGADGADGLGSALGDLGGEAMSTALDVYTRFQAAVGAVLGTLQEFTTWISEKAEGFDLAALIPDEIPGIDALDGLASALSGILDTIEGFGTFTGTVLVDYFKGYFAGLEPYLAPMAARLGAIWAQVGPVLDNFGRIGTAIGDMFSAIAANEGAMGAVETFGRVMGNLAGIVGNVTLTGLEGLLRWIETITGVMTALYAGDWAAVKTEISEFVDWLTNLSFSDIVPDFSGWISGNNDAAEAVERHKTALAGFAGDAEAAIAKLNELSQVEQNRVQFEANEGLAAAMQQRAAMVGELEELAGSNTFFSEWDVGAKLNDQLAANELDLAGYQDKLHTVMEAGGDYAEMAGAMLKKSFDFADAEADMARFQQTLANIEAAAAAAKAALPAGDTLPTTPAAVVANDNVAMAVPASPAASAVTAANDNVAAAAPAMPSVDTVRAAQAEVEALNAAIAAATAAGNALPAAIAGSLATVRAAVAAVDLTGEGVRIMGSLTTGLTTGGTGAAGVMTGTMAQISAAASLDLTGKGMSIMDTLAAGMRARAHAVVDEIRKVTQQVRDHLPSSPAKTGPLSDIHRLRFAETIAGSIRPDPVVRAMDAVARAGMAAGRPALPAIPTPRAVAPMPEAQRRAPIGLVGSNGASSSQAPASGPVTIDARLTIQGGVRFGTAEDKQEFEALLRRHSKTVAEVVGSEERRQRRLAF